MVRVVPGSSKRIPILEDTSKTPFQKLTSINPYQGAQSVRIPPRTGGADIRGPGKVSNTGPTRTQVGRLMISKFVVPKSSIPPPVQENRPWTRSALGCWKVGKASTD